MQYRVRDDTDTFELNPELSTIEEFRKLSDRQMKLVIFYADLKSPLRGLPDRPRREQCWKVVKGPMEGTRPDRNGRQWSEGKVESVELGIKRYKELQWDEDRDTLETLKAQIDEIKGFLKSDKTVPLVSKGKVVLDAEGEEIRLNDPKVLKLASELGQKLPDLVEAKKKLEDLLQIKDPPVEMMTGTSADLPPESLDGTSELSTIDQVMAKQQKNG